MKTLVAAFLIFGYLTLVSTDSELFCYECTPYETDCANHSAGQLYNCYNEFGDESTAQISVTCYSAFLNYTGVSDLLGNPRDSETGVYRGCGIIPSYLGDYCTWYRAELGLYNINIPSCESCNSSRCNRHTFDVTDGSITGLADNGSYMPVVSLVLYVLSLSLIYISK